MFTISKKTERYDEFTWKTRVPEAIPLTKYPNKSDIWVSDFCIVCMATKNDIILPADNFFNESMYPPIPNVNRTKPFKKILVPAYEKKYEHLISTIWGKTAMIIYNTWKMAIPKPSFFNKWLDFSTSSLNLSHSWPSIAKARTVRILAITSSARIVDQADCEKIFSDNLRTYYTYFIICNFTYLILSSSRHYPQVRSENRTD